MIKSNNQFSDFNHPSLDFSLDPTQDFYSFANNKWKLSNPVPSDRSRYGIFDKLAEKNETLLRKILEEASDTKNRTKSSLTNQIGNYYLSGMNTLKIERLGIDVLSEKIDRINKLTDKSELANIIAYFHKFRISPVFHFYGSPDPGNSEMNIAHLSQGGLGLSDRDYYLNDDQYSVELRSEYKKHIINMFILTGITEKTAISYSANILRFETRLAVCSMTRLEKRDPHKTYNKMNLEEFIKISPDYDWTEYFTSIGLNDPGIINICQPDFFRVLSMMISDEDLTIWKEYLLWYLINSTAIYLSSDFVKENFNFYGKVISGNKKLLPRWKRVLNSCNNYLGDSLGQIFVKKHFSSESKQRMLELVVNLKASLESRISNLDWMSQDTKEKAIDKLKNIRVKIGYPDKWKNYSSINTTKDRYLDNVLNGKKFAFNYLLNKIGNPVDRDEWELNVQTVNAYYNPLLNEIVFPAAILQPPFFYADDEVINYGAIGMVIGHEMTHGFDDQGRQYDKNGNLKNWWTEEDSKKFKKRSQVLIEQFDSYIVLRDIHADGKLCLGENIADLGGLNIALDALKKSRKRSILVKDPGKFTDIQRFFLSYSRIWAQNIRDKEILRLTKEDVHSLGKFT